MTDGEVGAPPQDVVRPRWPLLDGLRGVAVVLVIVFHLGIPPFHRGGFLGVEVFFVLSGFLITSLLVGEWGVVRRISLRYFYARRVIRLYPAQLALVLTVAVAALVITSGSTREDFLAGSLFSLLYVGNWVKAFNWHGQGALTHTWSLAIEEQYYLVWPLVAIATLKRGGTRALVWVALAMVAFFSIERIVLYLNDASLLRLYNGTDTRAPALLLGSALGAAIAGGHWLPRIPTWLTTAAVTAIVVGSIVLEDSRELHAFILLPFDVVVAVAIAGCALGSLTTPIGRVLTNRFAVKLGLLSYSLYLWHKAVIVILEPRLERFGTYPAVAIMTVIFSALAVGSYELVEKPFQRWRHRFQVPCGVPPEASPASPRRVENVSA